MPKLFSTRELFYRYKWLGDLRMNFFVWWCNHGTSFLEGSYRLLRVISPEARPFVDENDKPVIYAFYHQHASAVLSMHPRKRLTILISNSRDGEMIARGITALGFSLARGSSGKGGVKGALELLEAAKDGRNLAFMVDGPKGPPYKVKPGVLRIAELSGLPIIPIGFGSRGAWYMNSWDRFHAPAWGTPTVAIYGEPIYVPPEVSEERFEQLRVALEQRMEQLQTAASSVWACTT